MGPAEEAQAEGVLVEAAPVEMVPVTSAPGVMAKAVTAPDATVEVLDSVRNAIAEAQAVHSEDHPTVLDPMDDARASGRRVVRGPTNSFL
jgi:hypothetical protein